MRPSHECAGSPATTFAKSIRKFVLSVMLGYCAGVVTNDAAATSVTTEEQ
jgi:hypothetical protein